MMQIPSAIFKNGGITQNGGGGGEGWVVFKMMGDVLTPRYQAVFYALGSDDLVVLSYFLLKKVNYPIFMLV